LPISTTNFTPTTNALGIGGQDAVVLDNFAAAAMLVEHLAAVAPDERFVIRTISRMSEI
jgi:hypothetical protein